MVINEAELAGELKRQNKEGNLTAKDLETAYKDKIDAWYYYSNQAPIISFASNEWRDRHNIKENLVVLSYDDLGPEHSILRFSLGIQLDVDLIMVNQVMFTFRREDGYLVNNSTSEFWSWKDTHYVSTLMNPDHDFAGDKLVWFSFVFVTKVFRLLGAVIGFALLSFVNGLVVRIALMASNVIIFPLMHLM